MPFLTITAPNIHPTSKRGREVCQTGEETNVPNKKMWVQKDTLRTKQEKENLFGVLVLVEGIHQKVVDCFQFSFVINDAENGFAVFFGGLEDADFQL